MTPSQTIMFEHEDGGVALLETYFPQGEGCLFELSEEINFFGEKRERNTFLKEVSAFELSEQLS